MMGGGSPEICRASCELNKLRQVASCWLYFVNVFVMHGPTNVKSELMLRGTEVAVCCETFAKHITTTTN